MSGITRLLGVASVCLLAGIAVGYFIPKPAALNPTMHLSTTSVAAGAPFTVQISGFPANTELYGWVVNENPPKTFSLGITNTQGALEKTGNAPSTPGIWLLCASDEGYEYYATTTLTVT